MLAKNLFTGHKQPTYIGVIIHLLSTMDMPVHTYTNTSQLPSHSRSLCQNLLSEMFFRNLLRNVFPIFSNSCGDCEYCTLSGQRALDVIILKLVCGSTRSQRCEHWCHWSKTNRNTGIGMLKTGIFFNEEGGWSCHLKMRLFSETHVCIPKSIPHLERIY